MGERGRWQRRPWEPGQRPHHPVPTDVDGSRGRQESRDARRQAVKPLVVRHRRPPRSRASGQGEGGLGPHRLPDREPDRRAAGGDRPDHPGEGHPSQLAPERRGGPDRRGTREDLQDDGAHRRREGPLLLTRVNVFIRRVPSSSAMNEDAAFINEQVDRHHAWFSKSLPMIASENVISPMAREMLVTDFGDRYAEGLPHERYYQGNVFVDEVEDRVVALAKKLFRVRHMDPRLISGTVANMAVYFALLEPGDIMTSVALTHGAHISSARFGAAGMRGVNNVNYPFDVERMNIDVDETAKLLRLVKPKVAAFGQSVFLFPTPLRELRDAFQEAGCHVWYDGAHVMGLIAGGQFQDPLHEGADVLTGSTHKTLPGPQHGILLSDSQDEKFIKRLQRAVFPGVVSNHHLHAMAALGITLAEFLEFGRDYAAQIVRNAKALAQALHERGIKALAEKHGFTQSHAIALDVAALGGGAKVAGDLEKANIITNKNLLPWDTSSVKPSGIRLGTQELTRLGMRESEMDQVADLFARVAVKHEPPEKVASDVGAMRTEFNTVHYCFTKGAEAHRRWRIA